VRGAALLAAAGVAALSGCGGTSGAGPAAGSYGRIAVSFERNVGQAPAGVRLLARGPGYTLLLGERTPVLRLAPAGSAPRSLALGLAGTSSAMRLRTAGRRLGTVNYLVGPRRAWRRGVPTWSGARYTSAYPGIDVAFHGSDRRLEFDFEVAPGADPARIALAPRGQRGLRIDRDGALVLALPGGAVREQRPQTWQTVAGHPHRVASWFAIHRDGTVGIDVGSYDRSRALTIDPVLTYGTYLGGTSFDLGNGIAVDSSGAAYVTGTTAAANFPATTGSAQPAFAGNQDAFVAKLAPDGHSLAWATYLGGGGIDVANDVAVDSAGSAYVTGSTTSGDFPTTAGAFQTIAGGAGDGFVTKLSPTGSALVYSTYLGASGSDQGTGIAVTGAGAAVVAGTTGSLAFPTTSGAFQTGYGGGSSDASVTEVNPTGSGLVYSTYLGGSATDAGGRVVVDSAGAAYVTGRTQSVSFPTTAGAAQTALRGTSDAFAAKLPAGGASLAWSTLLGGTGTDTGEALAVDDAGAAYVTGSTTSTDLPSALNAYGGGANDGYAAKVAAGGASIAYSTYLGGAAGDVGRGIAVDAGHDAFVAGQTASSDFPVTSDALQATYPGGTNAAFLATLSPSGARAFSTFYGGSAGAAALGLALDGAGATYVTGSTNSSDLPGTSGAAQPANGGSTDAFVAKFSPTPATTTTTPTTPVTVPQTTPTDTTVSGQSTPGPRIIPGILRIRWDRVAVHFIVIGGQAIVLEVVTPSGRKISADLASGTSHGTLVWNRRIGGRIAPPGHYHLRLTSSTPDGVTTTKQLGATLRMLYAHAPRIRAGAAHIAYELTQSARVTLAIAPVGGPKTVVASESGRRGENAIAWNLRLHGRRVAGGEYQLFVTARAPGGRVASVRVPSR
jgi:hypothetical protein